MPRLVHHALRREGAAQLAPLLAELAAGQRRQNRLLALITVLLLVWLAVQYF
jgi:hypothetical protein